jgi:carboxymethylenebutenolidase
MAENELQVRTPDGDMTTFVVHPDGDGPWPVAILFMDGIGYRDQIKANARRFAAGGYYVIAPDLYYRSGQGVRVDFSRAGDPAYMEEMRRIIGTVTPERVEIDTQAALDAIAGDPAAAVNAPKVCVGYCLGARVSLHTAATRDDIVAAAGIHPGPLVTDAPDSPHVELPNVRGELYIAFSENDRANTAEQQELLGAELERRGVRGVVERVDGTTHGFAMADLPVYDRAASERHFEKTLDLWRRNLEAATVRG